MADEEWVLDTQYPQDAHESQMGSRLWGHMPPGMAMDIDRVTHGMSRMGSDGMSPHGMSPHGMGFGPPGMGMGPPGMAMGMGMSPPGMGFGPPGMGMGPPGMQKSPNPADFTGNNVGRSSAVRYVKELGSGAYAQCWQAEYNGQPVAAKVNSSSSPS